MVNVTYDVKLVWANQHGMLGVIHKKYITRPTYICPNCKSGFKLRRKSLSGPWFLNKCEWHEAMVNPERKCTGRTMKCPHCGEPLQRIINKHKTMILVPENR